jgi:hypothetical protein
MKITLFTSNNNRHNYLINLFSNICDELFVVQERRTIFPGIIPDHYPVSDTMKKYFENVNAAQNKFFGNYYVNISSKNIIIATTKRDEDQKIKKVLLKINQKK